MKNLFKAFSASMIALCMIGCGSGTHTINGNIEGLNGQVYLHQFTTEATPAIDSTMVSDGKFTFKVKTKDPVFAQLINHDGFFAPVLIDSKEITVSGDLHAPVVTGSPLTDKMHEVMQELMASVDSSTDDEWKEVAFRLIDENSDNLVGALVVGENAYYFTADEMIEQVDKLSSKMQQTIFVKGQREIAENKKSVEAGNMFKNITLTDMDGNEKRLSDYAGKGDYVLLDFWASWCGPCLREIPAVKELYAKYHERGFEIFAVSLDDNEESWIGAVDSFELPWPQVSSLTGWKCPAAVTYAVRAIPAMFLFNPQGVIEETNVSTQKLAEILGEAYPD